MESQINSGHQLTVQPMFAKSSALSIMCYLSVYHVLWGSWEAQVQYNSSFFFIFCTWSNGLLLPLQSPLKSKSHALSIVANISAGQSKLYACIHCVWCGILVYLYTKEWRNQSTFFSKSRKMNVFECVCSLNCKLLNSEPRNSLCLCVCLWINEGVAGMVPDTQEVFNTCELN